MLLDEPTNALDNNNIKNIQKLLKQNQNLG